MRTASFVAVAIVLAMVGTAFGALLGNVTAAQSGEDSFRYLYTDSNAPAPSVAFNWVDISTTGANTYAYGDDDVSGPFPIGFDFNFYGNRYSAFNVTTNGYIMFGLSSYYYSNTNIPNSYTPNNFIAAYWDDLSADYGEIVYDTVGTYPNRQLVVEFMNVTRLGGSLQMTYEIVLNETGWDIWVNYFTMNGLTGSSATEGIENEFGTTGVQYGASSAVLSDGLSIRYSLPDVVIGPSQTNSGHTGSVATHHVIATNKQATADSVAITYTSVEGWSVALYDGFMNPLTDTDADGLVDTGTLGYMESKYITVEVSIPVSPIATQEFTVLNASSHANPLLNFNCTLTSEILPAWLAPPHDDYGDDTDSDGLYNYLVVDVSVGVYTSGWYSIEAYLHTASEAQIGYDVASQNMVAGDYTLTLQFYGWDIQESAVDGPYHVHIYLYDTYWDVIDTGVHDTMAYTYDEFMLVPGGYAPPFSDNGVDTDSDGLYDLLQVDVNIDVNYAGRFVLYYTLYDPSSNALYSGTLDDSLPAGTDTVTLTFDAWDVSHTQVSGTYGVWMNLYAEVDSGLQAMGSYWYDTADYDVALFERASALFIGPYSDWTEDLDSDTLYDNLISEIGVNVTVEGDYLVYAYIEDWSDDMIVSSTNLTHLTVGDHMVQLVFPGWPIWYSSDSGPWDIHFTIRNGSVLLDEWDDNTGGYWYGQFETAPGWVEAPHSDAGVDTDSNALYDYLAVNVGVNVTVSGMYRISADLYDDWWDSVETTDNITMLSAGWNSVELRFTSRAINYNANDGVFHLYFNLYDSGNRWMDDDSYDTPSYLYGDFEGTPALFGWPHAWSTENDDADAAFERLVVTATVEVATDGRYLVEGTLRDSAWDWISVEATWADLEAGTQYVDISFPGWLINEFGVAGIYHVNLDLYDSTRYQLDWDSLDTATLQPGDFDPAVMSINCQWAYTAPAADGMVSPGEWTGATVIDLGSVALNEIDGEMRIMNDGTSLYILIDASGDMTMDEYDHSSIAFDTDNDEIYADGGEDQFVLLGTSWFPQVHYVRDSGTWSEHCYPFDDDGLYGGMGFGPSPASAMDHRIYEYAIPLSLLGASPGDILSFIARSAYYYGVYDDSESTMSNWPIYFWSQPVLSQFADLVLVDNAPEPPPVTTAAISGTAGTGGWYKSGTTVTFSATGGAGGVDYTEYRLAGGSWTTYTTALTISGEGTHSVEFRSVDLAAQTEATRTLTIKIDTVAPVSASAVSGASVWLNATDATSGIGGVMYRIDGGSWTTYSGVLTMSEAGTYVIDFYSVDAAGNQETTKSVTVEADEDDIPEDEPSPSNLMLYIGIGVAAAIAAALLILMLLMKRKKGQQPADMGMQSPPPPPA